MSSRSTILYRFHSEKHFRVLPLPGSSPSSARLADIEKAIVEARKLDRTSFSSNSISNNDFYFVIRNAHTGAEYHGDSESNDELVVPRGTRLIVKRLPAPRGQGLLARMTKEASKSSSSSSSSSSFRSAGEFVGGKSGGSRGEQTLSQAPSQHISACISVDTSGYHDSDDEFIDLSSSSSSFSSARSSSSSSPLETKKDSQKKDDQPVDSTGARPRSAATATGALGNNNNNNNSSGLFQSCHLRSDCTNEQNKEVPPKKRRRGVPRILQSSPEALHAVGFRELVKHGSGQSQPNASGSSSLLQLPKTITIPERLRCALCQGLVRNAVTLPWDAEKRTVCEQCIGDALQQTGSLYCPLTQRPGSFRPADLVPNHDLRALVDKFVKENSIKEEEQWSTDNSKVEGQMVMAELSEKNAITDRMSSGSVGHTTS